MGRYTGESTKKGLMIALSVVSNNSALFTTVPLSNFKTIVICFYPGLLFRPTWNLNSPSSINIYVYHIALALATCVVRVVREIYKNRPTPFCSLKRSFYLMFFAFRLYSDNTQSERESIALRTLFTRGKFVRGCTYRPPPGAKGKGGGVYNCAVATVCLKVFVIIKYSCTSFYNH